MRSSRQAASLTTVTMPSRVRDDDAVGQRVQQSLVRVSWGQVSRFRTLREICPRRRGVSGRGRRWARAEAYRQTAAAVARLRLSARPWIGIRTRWSASAATSSGSPQASLPNSQAVRPGEQPVVHGVVEVELAGPVGGEHGDARGAQGGRPRPSYRARG